MKKNITSWFALAAVIILVAGFFYLRQDPDILFARRVWSGVTNGDLSVIKAIDWPSLQVVGTDVGKDYSSLPNTREKDTYCKAFIVNFAVAFTSYGAKFNSFTNWRIHKMGRKSTIVAADTPREKVLLFTISNKAGERKLEAIQWKDEK